MPDWGIGLFVPAVVLVTYAPSFLMINNDYKKTIQKANKELRNNYNCVPVGLFYSVVWFLLFGFMATSFSLYIITDGYRLGYLVGISIMFLLNVIGTFSWTIAYCNNYRNLSMWIMLLLLFSSVVYEILICLETAYDDNSNDPKLIVASILWAPYVAWLYFAAALNMCSAADEYETSISKKDDDEKLVFPSAANKFFY